MISEQDWPEDGRCTEMVGVVPDGYGSLLPRGQFWGRNICWPGLRHRLQTVVLESAGSPGIPAAYPTNSTGFRYELWSPTKHRASFVHTLARYRYRCDLATHRNIRWQPLELVTGWRPHTMSDAASPSGYTG